jgi:hypothetical protein
MGKIREKIEGWLAPENARNGVPTYIPRQKFTPRRLGEEENPSEEQEQPTYEEQANAREMIAGSSDVTRRARYAGLAGGLALLHEAGTFDEQ